jgi:hypothetical protein
MIGLGLWCLMPLSTIFQLYHGSQFYWWRKVYIIMNTTHDEVYLIQHYVIKLSKYIIMNTTHDEVYLIQHYVIKLSKYIIMNTTRVHCI